MHDMIRRQAVAARATYRSTTELLTTQPLPAPEGRLLFVGLGTSFHAALAAGHAARRALARRVEVEVRTSFDILDGEVSDLAGTTSVVFSESGATAFTVAAQEALRREKSRVVLITARPTSRSASHADALLPTQYAEEASWTHTVSFTAGLVAAGRLLDSWAGAPPVPEGAEDATAEVVTAALATENAMLDLVDEYAGRDRFLFVASGAAEASARESALKLREAAGRFCAVVGVEEALHGVLPSVGERSVVFGITGTELERDRALQVLAAARVLGAKTLLVDTSGGPAGDGIVTLPSGERPLPPVLQVIPFQLLAYWTATAEGRNPDVMGLDDPRQLAARRTFGI